MSWTEKLNFIFSFLFTSILVEHSWSTLRDAVQAHIGSLNWGYRVALRDKDVTYFNGFAEFVDPHTIKVSK